MATLADVRRWDPTALETAFTGFGTARDRLLDADTDLYTARPPARWTGIAADGARREHERLAEQARRVAAGVTALRPVLAEALDTLTELRRDLDRADGLAMIHGLAIGPDGTVAAAVPAADGAALQRQAAGQAETVGLLERVLARAEMIDAAVAQALARAAAGAVDDGTGDTLAHAADTALGILRPALEPPPGGTPEANALWWDRLTAAQQERLLLTHPGWIGNLDGVPAGVRDQANRAQLDDEAARLDREHTAAVADLRRALAVDSLFPLAGPSERTQALSEHLARIDDQRAALGAITKTVAGDGHQLLLLDLDSGAEPRAAVAVGDVATADHVAVFTPGFTTTVAGSLGDHVDDADALQQESLAQLDLAGRDTETVAVVAWLGYDAPQWDTTFTADQSVATTDAARAGGHDLARFLDGIDIARDTTGADDPHLTALGHSYGSTTTGFALQEARGVDDAAVFGSPGLSTSDLDRLNIDPGRIAVLEATGDPVADLGAFGTDPNTLPGVVDLSTDMVLTPDGLLRASTGHSDYLEPGTTSQHNLAATVAGLPDQRITGDNLGLGDLARGVLGIVAAA